MLELDFVSFCHGFSEEMGHRTIRKSEKWGEIVQGADGLAPPSKTCKSTPGPLKCNSSAFLLPSYEGSFNWSA